MTFDEAVAKKRRFYISQPMDGLSNEERLAKREEAIIKIKKKFGDDVYILDSFFGHVSVPSYAKSGVWCLGESMKMLAFADYAYFVDGWNAARGCCVEQLCAIAYEIKCIYEEDN